MNWSDLHCRLGRGERPGGSPSHSGMSHVSYSSDPVRHQGAASPSGFLEIRKTSQGGTNLVLMLISDKS